MGIVLPQLFWREHIIRLFLAIKTLQILKISARKRSDVQKAREWYAKAIEMESYDVLFEYAESFSMSGDFETGVKVALEGLDILTKSNHPDTSIKAHLYSLLAYYYNIQGFGSDAIRVMELAENLITNNEYLDNPFIAMIYRDYAAVLNRNGYEQKALEYYEKSEVILRNENDPHGLAATLNGKAIIYEDSGKYEKAVEIYEEALAALEGVELLFDEEHTIGYINANIVHSLLELGHYEKALLHAERATAIIAKMNRGHPWHFRALSDLARVFEKLNRVDEAYITHMTSADIFTARYLSNRDSEIDMFTYGEYYQNIHPINEASDFLFRLYSKSGDQKYLDKAFLTFQKTRITKAEFEMNRLSNRLAVNSSEQSADLREYQQLSDELDGLRWSYLETIVFENADDKDIDILKAKIEDFESRKTLLNNNLKDVLNKNILSFDNRFLSLKKVQETLTDGQVLVFPAETFSNTRVTVFLISNSKVITFQTSMIAEEIREAGLQLRASLQFTNSEAKENLPKFDLELSHEIFNQLFSDKLNQFSKTNELIVVPTWPISNLPLAVLIENDPSKTNGNYSNQSWLGLQKNITYLTAVADLNTPGKSEDEPQLASFLGFGNPKLGESGLELRGLKLVNESDTIKLANRITINSIAKLTFNRRGN